MLGPSPERRLGFRRVGATLGNTFLSAYEDQNTGSDQNTNAWLPARRVSSSSIWDVQGSWKGTKDLRVRVRVRVGIRNLFDDEGSEGYGATRVSTGTATAAAPSAAGQTYFNSYGLTPPRVVGVELQYRF